MTIKILTETEYDFIYHCIADEESDFVIVDQAKFAVLVIKAKPMFLASEGEAA